jgi:hypothetical protein
MQFLEILITIIEKRLMPYQSLNILSNTQKKRTNIKEITIPMGLIGVFGLIHLVFYFIISRNNSFHSDDLQILTDLREFGYYHFLENPTNFEFPLVLPGHILIYKILGNSGDPTRINMFIYLSNFLTFYLLLTTININKTNSIIGSLLCISALYISVRASNGWGNVSYWAAGQLPYFFSLNYIFLGFFFLCKYYKMQKKYVFFIASVFLFLTFNIKINLSLIIFIYALMYYYLYRNKMEYFYNIRQFIIENKYKITILCIIIILSTMWLFGNPGNFKRLQIQGTHQINWNLVKNIKLTALGMFEYFKTTFTNLRLLISAILLSIYFHQLETRFKKLVLVRNLRIHATTYILALSSQTALISLLFNKSTYFDNRFYFFIDIATLLFICCLFLFIYEKLSFNLNRILTNTFLLLSILYLLKFDYRIFAISKEFKKIHSENLKIIKTHIIKKTTQDVFLKKNPYCFILGFPPLVNKTERDTGDSVNDFHTQNYKLEKYFKTPFKLFSE